MKFRGVKQDVEIPEWANWIAMDKSGHWWAYEYKPELELDWTIWVNTSLGITQGLCHPIPQKSQNWTEEIYKIYWEEV